MINLFSKLQNLSLILFGGLVPGFFLILTILFILMHIQVICLTTILNLLFDSPSSTGYEPTYKFITSGKEFLGNFIDKMFTIIKVTFDSLLGDDNLFDFTISGEDKCPTPKQPQPPTNGSQPPADSQPQPPTNGSQPPAGN